MRELLPLDKVLQKPAIEKTAPIASTRIIDEKEHRDNSEKKQHKHTAAEAYQSVSALPQMSNVIMAEQIMSSSVVTLSTESFVVDALALFRAKQIRHLPVMSPDGLLVGIVSERDVLRYLSGLTENYQQDVLRNTTEQVIALMKSPVITASADTDVRYIARLFVERRVGALPIVENKKLTGIIARSDVLNAVMRHFLLDWWA